MRLLKSKSVLGEEMEEGKMMVSIKKPLEGGKMDEKVKVSAKAVLVLTIALLLIGMPVSAKNENVKVSIEDCSAAKDNTTSVPLMIRNVTDVGSAKVNLTYNESVVSVTGVSNSDFDFSRLADRGSGWVLLKAGQKSKGLSGDVKMFDVTLKAVGDKGDQTLLKLNDVLLEDMGMDTIPVDEVVNGAVSIGEAGFSSPTPSSTEKTPIPTTPAPTLSPRSTPTQSPSPSPTPKKTSVPSTPEVLSPTPEQSLTHTPAIESNNSKQISQTPLQSPSTPTSNSIPGFEAILAVAALALVLALYRS